MIVWLDFRSRPFADINRSRFPLPHSKHSCKVPDLKSNECDGLDYYRLVGASDIGKEDLEVTNIAWTDFFTATLPGGPLEHCVLAGVENKDDLANVEAAVGQEPFTYVGVRKSPEAVVRDGNRTSSGVTKKRRDWFNLDGSEVPRNVWAENKPDNRVSLQAYGIYNFDAEGLDDIENYRPGKKGDDFVFNKAVVRCCPKGYIPNSFCTAE